MRLCVLSCALSIFLANITNTAAAYNILEHWTKRSTASVSRVRYCGGLFVGVGAAGMIVTSSNGVAWTRQTSNTSSYLSGVAFGTLEGFGNVFVVGGDNSLLISPDARHWTNLAQPNGIRYPDVAYLPLGFVAVGYPGNFGVQANVLISPFPSSTNWRALRVTNSSACLPFEPSSAANFHSIVAAGSTFIAVGDLCTGIWTSSSGTTWTYRAGRNSQYFQGVAYGNGKAIAIGMEGPPHVSVSPFSTWTTSLINTNPGHLDNFWVGWDVAFGDGRFAVINGTNVTETTKGTNWTIHRGALPMGCRSIAFGAGTFVAAGDGIFQSASTAGTLAVHRATNGGPVELSVAAETGRTFGLQASLDLTSWSEIGRATNNGGTNQFFDWSVTNGTSRFYRTVTP